MNSYASDKCNTCSRPASDPYRRYDQNGKIVEGCVDEIHGDHLPIGSDSFLWHCRLEAHALRFQTKARLEAGCKIEWKGV